MHLLFASVSRVDALSAQPSHARPWLGLPCARSATPCEASATTAERPVSDRQVRQARPSAGAGRSAAAPPWCSESEEVRLTGDRNRGIGIVRPRRPRLMPLSPKCSPGTGRWGRERNRAKLRLPDAWCWWKVHPRNPRWRGGRKTLIPCDNLIQCSDKGRRARHLLARRPPVCDPRGARTRERDLIAHKTSLGAFELLEPGQDPYGIWVLVICGISTSGCVESTARDAADRGCAVVVDEGCAGYEIAAHETSLRALQVNFGCVARGADDVFHATDAKAAL